jgi:hypothetical protein
MRDSDGPRPEARDRRDGIGLIGFFDWSDILSVRDVCIQFVVLRSIRSNELAREKIGLLACCLLDEKRSRLEDFQLGHAPCNAVGIRTPSRRRQKRTGYS